MKKILFASSIDPQTIDSLSGPHDVLRAFNAREEVLCDVVGDREVLIFRSGVKITGPVLSAGPDLRLLIRAGSGLDNVDLDTARRLGLRVVRVPGSSAQPVAEFTFALILSLARKVVLADRLLRQGHWPKSQLGGPLVAGKTLGIVGAGNIGSRVAELGRAWGMRAVGCVRNGNGAVRALPSEAVELTDFDTVVAEADFLCLHVPLDESTAHMVDARVLSHMKPGAFLINVARGGVVDEEALYWELAEGGRLGGAALDVHEQEGEGTMSRFADLPNVVLTPHIGAMALDAQREIGDRVIQLVDAYVDNRLDRELRDGENVI